MNDHLTKARGAPLRVVNQMVGSSANCHAQIPARSHGRAGHYLHPTLGLRRRHLPPATRHHLQPP